MHFRIFLACLAVSLCATLTHAEELINWHTSLDSARQVSQQYKVPILLHFYGNQCMPCKSLEKNVFSRPEVASTMQRYFVPVHINASEDRQTAAEFNVHSWPTDVFIAPDGKVLTQGVCNQNPNNYLQTLQNVAIMNRDRNTMLAANTAAPSNTTPTAANVSPYGRTASNNLQQSAPGREAAPTPYSNPSSGSAPYQGQTSSALASNQSTLPSPTWSGQSANGQAQSGLQTAGPLPSSNAMTVHPSQPATSTENKQANVPPAAPWQTNPAGSVASSFSHTPASAQPSSTPGPALNLPTNTAPPAPSVKGPTPWNTTGKPSAPINTVVDNPHYANAKPQLPNASTTTPAQLTSTPLKSEASTQPQASVPALNGFCPVTLFSEGQWIEGKPQFAVRHRGRIYFLSSQTAIQRFMATPDEFCPVLSGFDPLVFIRDGRLVDGSVYDGLKDPKLNRILLFSSAENKKYFQENYDRLAAELENILNPTPSRTASNPGATVR